MNQRDKHLLYKHIFLNEGAYFYRNDDLKINNELIDSIFKKTIDENVYKIWTVIKRRKEEIISEYADTAYCSLLVFSISSYPTFLDKNISITSDIKERKNAYLLIIEIKNYVVIVKKNISNISDFITKLTPIDGKIITGSLVTKDTFVQHMKLTNMNMNENAMRNKSYEALDLENTMPMFNASQSIITSTRISNDNEIYSLNVNTSRISKFGKKKTIKDLIVWAIDIINLLESYIPSDNFISHFATPIIWKNFYDKLQPSSLLINTLQLTSYLSTLNDKSIYFAHKNADDNYEYKDCSNLFLHLIKRLEKCLNLSMINNKEYVCDNIRNLLQIKCNKLGIKIIGLKALSSFYYINEDGKYCKIIDLINQQGLFSISFVDYSYIYTAKRLYKNSDILNNLGSIMYVFEDIDEMNNVTSEKGQGYVKESIEFSEGSIFNVVEKHIFQNADCLVCDDMGNEWADHIALRGSTISFIHSKCHNGASLSASNFQEVIGQAVKNIGNLNPNNDELDKKSKNLEGYIKGTSIKRCRIGSIQNFITKYKELRYNPNLIKEVCLAIDFISKVQLENAFIKIKNNQNFKQKNSVIQLIWLLNGFISTCKEADLHCRIFCKP